MSGGISASTVIAGAGLAASAAGTVSQIAGQGKSAGASAAQAEQSAAWQGYNNQVQAKAASQQAAWARSLAQQREVLAQRSATDLQQQGDVAAAENDSNTEGALLANAQTAGTARATLAGSGVDAGDGSAANIQGDIAARGAYAKEVGDFNTATIRANTARAVYGANLSVASATDDERVAQAQQDNAKPGLVGTTVTSNPSLLQGATALSGASNLAQKWWTFQQQGGFGGGGSNADPFLDTSINNPAAAWAAAVNGPVTAPSGY